MMREASSHPIRYSILRRALVVAFAAMFLWGAIPVAAGEPAAKVGPAKKLDVNRAQRHELDRLPGIFSQDADRIIRNRPYRKLDELVTKKAVTRKQFALIREYVSVGR
jgi:DNA uptake protein ComE-like DNA-binding protein